MFNTTVTDRLGNVYRMGGFPTQQAADLFARAYEDTKRARARTAEDYLAALQANLEHFRPDGLTPGEFEARKSALFEHAATDGVSEEDINHAYDLWV